MCELCIFPKHTLKVVNTSIRTQLLHVNSTGAEWGSKGIGTTCVFAYPVPIWIGESSFVRTYSNLCSVRARAMPLSKWGILYGRRRRRCGGGAGAAAVCWLSLKLARELPSGNSQKINLISIFLCFPSWLCLIVQVLITCKADSRDCQRGPFICFCGEYVLHFRRPSGTELFTGK